MPFCLNCMQKHQEEPEAHKLVCSGKVTIPKTLTCKNCGKMLGEGQDHDCPTLGDDPRRMTDDEIKYLVKAHGEYHWGIDKANQSALYVEKLKEEIKVREKIFTTAQQQKERFGKIPLPSSSDICGARFAILTLENTARPKGCALSIGSPSRIGLERMTPKFRQLSLTRMLAAVSGEDDKVRVIQGHLETYFGDIFQFGPSQNMQFVANQSISKGMSSHQDSMHVKVCAEPKLMGTLVQFQGMTTVWVGSEPNPWPLFSGELGFGSPMVPCLNCKNASLDFRFYSNEDSKWIKKDASKQKPSSPEEKKFY